MIVGEGMFHCYPVFPIVKEAKEGWDMMVCLCQRLKQLGWDYPVPVSWLERNLNLEKGMWERIELK